MLTLLLVVLAAPKPAPAASSAPAKTLPARAAVFVQGGGEAEGRLDKALDEAHVSLLDLESAFPAPGADPLRGKLLKDAKDAYDNLDYDVAASKYQEALEGFSKNPAGITSQQFAEAHFFTGVILLQNGGKSQAKKAQEAFAKALLHDPTLQLDEKVYGKDVKRAFDKAVSEVSARAQGTLRVESTPPGAEAALRGRSLGHTPIASGPSVPYGKHLITFTKPGYEPAAVLVEVRGDGGNAQAELRPIEAYAEVRQAADALIASDLGKGKVPAGAHKLAEVARARFLVLAKTEGGKTNVEAWDVESGNQLTGLTLTDDASYAAVAQKVKGFVASPAPAKLRPSAEAGEPVAGLSLTGGEPIYKKWWFWTAVGVVVVAGVATGVAVGVANQPQPFNPVLSTPGL